MSRGRARRALHDGARAPRAAVISSDRTAEYGRAINLGDALLTDALAGYVAGRGFDVVVVDFATEPRVDADRSRVSRLRGLADLVRSVDLVLLGGGTLLQDDQPGKRFGGLSRLCLTVVLLCRVLRVRVAFVGVGIDSVHRPVIRACLRIAIRAADDLLVRDPDSLRRAREDYGRAATLAGDTALLVDAGHRTRPDRSPGTPPVAVVALNRVDARALTPESVGAIASTYGRVRFLSMDQGPDADVLSVPPDVRGLIDVVDGPLSWKDVLREIGASDVVLASRMHALYVALLLAVPCVAVGSSDKVSAFAAEMHIIRGDLTRSTALPAPRVAHPAAAHEARARLEAALGAVLESVRGRNGSAQPQAPHQGANST